MDAEQGPGKSERAAGRLGCYGAPWKTSEAWIFCALGSSSVLRGIFERISEACFVGKPASVLATAFFFSCLVNVRMAQSFSEGSDPRNVD